MCSPVVDCKTCKAIERCPRVAAAFPTDAEEREAKSKARIRVTACMKRNCGAPRAKSCRYCYTHERERHRAAYWKRKAAAHV